MARRAEAEQALEKGDVAVASRSLPAIAQQADTSVSLVASLLELARVGEAKLTRQRIDPPAMARDVIDQFKLKPGGSPLPGCVVKALPMVEADPALLRSVERHGGTVWAESSPGRGACVSFTLPAAGCRLRAEQGRAIGLPRCHLGVARPSVPASPARLPDVAPDPVDRPRLRHRH